MTNRADRPVSWVFWVVLVDLVGFGIVLPLLPSRAAEFTSNETLIGIAVAAFSFMQFLLAPWWGRLSDRIGRRPVLMIGFLGSAVSYLLFAIAPSYWVLLGSRVLAGGAGATVNVAQAALADVTRPDERARAMGLIGVAFGLGFILGPAIAGLTSETGSRVPGLIAAALCLVSCLIAWWKLPETRVTPTSAPRTSLRHLRSLGGAGAAMFLSVLAFAVITVIFPLFATGELGLGRRAVSGSFVILGLASALVQGWLVGRLAPRWGERALMVTGGILLGVGLAALPLTHGGDPAELHLPAFVMSLAVLAAGSGLIWPAAAAYVSRRFAGDEQGAALGALHSVASAARVFGPVLLGWTGEREGFGTAFVVAAVLAGGAAIAGLSSRGRDATSLRSG